MNLKFKKKSYKLPIAAVIIIIILGAIVVKNYKNIGLTGKNSSTKTVETKKAADNNKKATNEKEASSIKNNEAPDKNDQSENTSVNSNDKNNGVSNAKKKEGKIAKIENAAKGNNASGIYYGNWHLSKVLGTIPVTAMDEKQMQNYMGTKINISKESFSDASDGTISNPNYVKSTVSADEFLAENKTSLKKLGIEGDSIQKIEVKSSKGITQGLLYVTNNGTIITEIDGVFFKID